MNLKDIYSSGKPAISYEIFPPKSKTTEENQLKIQELFDELTILSKYKPSFVSVTYGAGGSTRTATFDIVERIKNELNIQPMPHFTCIGSSKEYILEYIKKFESIGIENILALRGDPPKGEQEFVKAENGFGYANELVEFIKANTELSIGVAGYPECHQDCESLETDIKNLKKKVFAGAHAVITQLFYDNECYFRFLEMTSAEGINIPIIPGILPITSYNQIEKIVFLSGCKLSDEFRANLEKHKDNPDSIKEIGLEFAVNQANELLKNQVPGLHFYTLNKSFATDSVLRELKI